QQSAIARIQPEDPFLSFHRFQHIYMPLLYVLYSLNWFLVRDFKDFRNIGWGSNKELKLGRKDLLELIGAKLLYFSLMVILPSLISPLHWGWFLLGFFIKHAAASLFGVLALVSVHVGADAVFFQAGKDDHFEESWAELQFLSAIDFSPKNRLIRFLFGGFNLHTCHHLFPHINHIHYPAITCIMRSVAAEYRLPYRSRSLGAALISHWHFLRNHSMQPQEILEEAF
ncbi:MAG: fatty acid desaturase, partial [Bacteroidota bacterium]